MHVNVKVRPNPAKCTQAQGEPGLKHERITVLWYSKLYGTARCTAVRGRGNTPLTLSPYYNKKNEKKILNFYGQASIKSYDPRSGLIQY